MGLILSIDVGTTNLKAGVIDETGRVLAMRRTQTPIHRPERGAAEHDPRDLYDIMISVCREISKKYKHDIAHIILSTYQLGLVLVDEHLSPLTGLTLLSDMRARETVGEFHEQLDMASLYLRTGCPPMFQYPFARLFYFKKRRPELIAKTKYFLGCKDYLLLQLTGEALTEPSIAAATQMFNINSLSWDSTALNVLGIGPKQLPRPVDGIRTAIPVLESVRKELGLTSTKLDVFPGIYDGGALAVGLSGLAPDIGVMNIGTSALVRVPGTKPVFDSKEEMRLQPYCLAENLYLNGGALNNATLPLNWMREKLFEPDLDNIPELKDTKNAPIFCLPYLTGERDSKIGPFASGVFFGLRDHHGRQEMLRSVMEGVAFSLCMVKEALLENHSTISELRLGGGGAGSKAWTQILADVFNAPIKLPNGEEVALVGSAMLAYTALGVYESLEKAKKEMTSVGEIVEPIAENVKIYAEHYEFFKKLRSEMGELYRAHVKLTT